MDPGPKKTDFAVNSLKHLGLVCRLRPMRRQLPTLLFTTARTAAMVGLAVLLILVLLPAMLAVQAAGVR